MNLGGTQEYDKDTITVNIEAFSAKSADLQRTPT